MRIVLIGYRGTGKTTVGELLARDLGRPFIDLDPLIEQQAGMSIADIFRRFGEEHFRGLESRVIAGLDPQAEDVISAGGGAILREQNVRLLRGNSLVVWLTASAETLHARIGGDATTAQRRPDLTALSGLAEIRHLLAVREPLYRGACDLEIDTDALSVRQIAERIVEKLTPRLL